MIPVVAPIGIAVIAFCVLHGATWARGKVNRKRKSSELDSLIEEERTKQALPLIVMIASHVPVDVESVTLTLHYEDGNHLQMDCGKSVAMGAPKL